MQGTSLPSLVEFGPVVEEEKMFKEIVDAGRTDGRTDGRTTDDGKWSTPIAHLEHFVLR